MKVIAIFFHRISGAGGAERMACLLANELSSRGFSVYLLTLDEKNSLPFYTLNSAVRWVKIGFRGGIIDKFRRAIYIY
ncbi:hypothetical protein ACOI9R_32460, partial [Mesorhizobium japonicum]